MNVFSYQSDKPRLSMPELLELRKQFRREWNESHGRDGEQDALYFKRRVTFPKRLHQRPRRNESIKVLNVEVILDESE